nr:hypothetical protein GCM10020092_045890 [Actinoplanes digitatis]
MRRQRVQIAVERRRQVCVLPVAGAGDQRRLLHQPDRAVVLFGEAGQRAVAGAAPGPAGGPFDLLAEAGLGGRPAQVVDVEGGEGAGQQRLRGEVADLLAVLRDAVPYRVRAGVLAEAVLPCRRPRRW